MSPHLVAALCTEWSAEQFNHRAQGAKGHLRPGLALPPDLRPAAHPHDADPAFTQELLGPVCVDGHDVEAPARSWFTCPFNHRPAFRDGARRLDSEGLPVGLQMAGRRLDNAPVPGVRGLRGCRAMG